LRSLSFISPTRVSWPSALVLLSWFWSDMTSFRTGWWVELWWSGSAVGAQAAVDDLSLVDGEAVGIRRVEARCGTDGAVDIGDDATRPTDDVVVVVPDSRLVPRDRAGWLDAAHET
jgi:hypothetical protein